MYILLSVAFRCPNVLWCTHEELPEIEYNAAVTALHRINLGRIDSSTEMRRINTLQLTPNQNCLPESEYNTIFHPQTSTGMVT
jgi:hypothetical protein